ncbi:hypothetical protein BpHYR1_034653, partial [Brachionus plicatilis]
KLIKIWIFIFFDDRNNEQKDNPIEKKSLILTFCDILYTKNIIIELLKINQNDDYISNTLKILNEIELNQNTDITIKCKYYRHKIDIEHETNKKDNPVLTELHKIFKQLNVDEIQNFSAI